MTDKYRKETIARTFTQKSVTPVELSVGDILGREIGNIDYGVFENAYRGKTVLVTGGGGSIGSQLCRQLARCGVGHLIILDIYENNAYELCAELSEKYKGDLKVDVQIASVRDRERLESVFQKYHPEIVFHAAAHKHVSLMESAPGEAVKNNVFGTYNAANAAEKYNARKFVLISTDKAVNPTGVMGAAKRLCEMIISSMKDSKTVFSAVRFGNVFDSMGSVARLFRRQIASGGPVTVTDMRATRYFMTVSEAVALVMQAGAAASGGEMFVLDMGESVKISDIAERMIRLSGYEPYKDIDIIETGLKSGEKLHEELCGKTGEALMGSKRIYIENDESFSREQVEAKLSRLGNAVKTENKDEIIAALREAVPTYDRKNGEK